MPIFPTLETLAAGYRQRGGGTGGATRGAMSGASAGATAGSILPGIGTGIGAAVGGLVGGIGGLVNKRAATAPTDYAVDDARRIITDAFTQFNGRAPQPGEVDQMIVGQGWKPGHRWVGSGGLQSVLSSLQRNAQQAQSQAAPTVNARTGISRADPSRARLVAGLRSGGGNMMDLLIAKLRGEG